MVSGPAFFLLLPCSHILRNVYSFCNLNATSWGTREAKTASSAQGEPIYSWSKIKSFFHKGSNASLAGGQPQDRAPVPVAAGVVEEADDQVVSVANWYEDIEALGDGAVAHLDEAETSFWNGLIEKYLKPLERDPKKEEQTREELKEFRDNVVFYFLIISCVWV